MPSSIKVRKKSGKKSNSTDINLLVNTETNDVYFEWDRIRITKALKEEAGISDKVAREIAQAVEDKVLKSGIQKISTSLIRELVDNELFDRGEQKKLEKQTSIGLPKSDIEELIFSKSKENSNIASNNPEAIQHSLSETILKQYALQEIFSEEVAEAHKTGRVHVHDLGYPVRVYAFSKETKLMVMIRDPENEKNYEVKEMTMIKLWEYCDCESKQINETQWVKDVNNCCLYVLDRNKWVKLQRVIISNETKKMYTFDLQDSLKVCVTEDHGCVVKRDDKMIIIRADEIKYTDEFVNVTTEESDGDLYDMQQRDESHRP